MLQELIRRITQLDKEWKRMDHEDGLVTWEEVDLISNRLDLDFFTAEELKAVGQLVINFLSRCLDDKEALQKRIDAYISVIEWKINQLTEVEQNA